jgi:hypothetical protein
MGIRSAIMSKKKKELASFKSELHTISPLPLEVVAERLRDLERKNLPIHLVQLDEDEFGFVMRLRHRGSLSDAQVLGTLWRWNGTFTRIDVDSKIELLGQWLDVAVQLIGVIFAVLLLVPFFWLFSEFVIPYYSYDPAFGLFFTAILIAAATIALLIVRSIAQIDLLADSRYRSLRHIDSMMQAIADKLSENQPADEPLLEFDGSEISLAALLDSEKYKYLRLGEDGEVDTP